MKPSNTKIIIPHHTLWNKKKLLIPVLLFCFLLAWWWVECNFENYINSDYPKIQSTIHAKLMFDTWATMFDIWAFARQNFYLILLLVERCNCFHQGFWSLTPQSLTKGFEVWQPTGESMNDILGLGLLIFASSMKDLNFF